MMSSFADQHHQPLTHVQSDRGDELRGSRARFSRRGRVASGVQQPLCSPEITAQRQGSSAHAGPALGEPAPWMFNSVAVHGAEIAEISYETDRMQFIGRGNTIARPSPERSAALSESGSVLDPISPSRHRITIGSGRIGKRSIMVPACAKPATRLEPGRKNTRIGVSRPGLRTRSGRTAQVVLRQINATRRRATAGLLAAPSFMLNSSLRADAAVLIKNRRGQSGLWGYAIPRICDSAAADRRPAHIDLLRQLVQAHAYWPLEGLAVDLVIWNEDRTGYRQLLTGTNHGV